MAYVTTQMSGLGGTPNGNRAFGLGAVVLAIFGIWFLAKRGRRS